MLTRKALARAALAALPILVVWWFVQFRSDKRALSVIGYDERAESPTEFFGDRARHGLSPREVARAMPTPTRIDRFIAPTSGDSVLLERYVYQRGIGRWDAYIYYGRGEGVVDVYAQDVPSTNGARSISAEEAERWNVTIPTTTRDQLLAPSLDSLIGTLKRIAGTFSREPDRSWSFTGSMDSVSLFDTYGDSAVHRLVECLEDTSPASATVQGRRVLMGAMCHWALRQLAYFEWHDDPAFSNGWPGDIDPSASPDQLRAASTAWKKVVGESRYSLL